jgi:Integrase core domain
MGSVGDAYDNALAEAFFATLETELLMRHTFVTRKAARLALFDYIEAFYNSHRRHSALGYLSPQRSSGGGGSRPKPSEDTLTTKRSVKQPARIAQDRLSVLSRHEALM